MSQTVEATQRAGKKRGYATFVRSFEWCLAAALTLAWVVYHIRFFLHAGGLWRDEVNSVDLCNSPRISDIIHNLQYDSFPLLWHLVLRVWIRSGIGSTDRGIRVLGLLTGLGLLGAIWYNARRFRFPTPIAMLTLLGFSSAVVCYGDSIRGYGLGMMLGLLTLGFMWDVATRPSAVRIALALIAALASVQMLFYNTVILFAICCGAMAVAIGHRKWKRAGIILGIGIFCAASMTPYHVLTERSRGFRAMLLHDPNISWLLTKFTEAVSYDAGNQVSIYTSSDKMWEGAIFFALFVALLAAMKYRGVATDWGAEDASRGSDAFRRDVLKYHLVILLVGVVGYWAFLHSLSYLMQPWYYLALLALVAACVDGLLASMPTAIVRTLLCAGGIGYCVVTAGPDWYDAGLRKTNLDLISAEISPMQQPGDLIVISPWFFAITFQRYYHGPADLVTVPEIDFLAYHKYDLLIGPMTNVKAMDPIIERMMDALRSGHVVYLVGDFVYPNKNAEPLILQAAPHSITGWEDGPYYFSWEDQLSYFLTHHAALSERIRVPYYGISNYERPLVTAVKGLRGQPTTSDDRNEAK